MSKVSTLGTNTPSPVSSASSSTDEVTRSEVVVIVVVPLIVLSALFLAYNYFMIIPKLNTLSGPGRTAVTEMSQNPITKI